MRHMVLIFAIVLMGCDKYPVSTGIKFDVAGSSGAHTPVYRNTEGNMLGYYEYLPKEFDENSNVKYPVIFYWNGKNAIKGNGKKQLKRLLLQGLSKNIDNGKHYKAIVITPQLFKGDWKSIDVDPFVSYILKRYEDYIDTRRVYMTGFSAGGGISINYALSHADKLAAIVPVSPAIRFAVEEDKSNSINKLGVWFFHNRGDDVISFNRSISWLKVLSDNDDIHKLTIYDEDGHHAWQRAYDEPALWDWLLSQKQNH